MFCSLTDYVRLSRYIKHHLLTLHYITFHTHRLTPAYFQVLPGKKMVS